MQIILEWASDKTNGAAVPQNNVVYTAKSQPSGAKAHETKANQLPYKWFFLPDSLTHWLCTYTSPARPGHGVDESQGKASPDCAARSTRETLYEQEVNESFLLDSVLCVLFGGMAASSRVHFWAGRSRRDSRGGKRCRR